MWREQKTLLGACLLWLGLYAGVFSSWEPNTMVYRVSDLLPFPHAFGPLFATRGGLAGAKVRRFGHRCLSGGGKLRSGSLSTILLGKQPYLGGDADAKVLHGRNRLGGRQ